ncbi:hypothetical protein JZ751_001639, partial [Albula glossodonta]
MAQACRDFLDLAETHSRRWQRALQYEREQRIHLEETIEQLAKQHNSLERAWREAPALAANTNTPAAPASEKAGNERPQKGEASDEDEDTEYFDAMEDSPAFITITQARTTSTDAARTERWFCDQTGKTTDTQRSTLMRTRRKMLLNMLRNMMKEMNLHMKSPSIHLDVNSLTESKGRKKQNMKSETARLRYQ